MFHIINDEFVILRQGGVYAQAKLFRYNDGVYAQKGGGFIRLHRNGGTSVPKVSWENYSMSENYDRLGRMIVPGAP